MTFRSPRDKINVRGRGNRPPYAKRQVEIGMENVTVQVQRTVRVGQTLRINPSEGYLGITSGVIQVLYIGTKDDMKSSDNSQVQEAVGQVEADYYSYLDVDSSNKERLDNEPWVVFSYNTQYVTGLPLDEFLDHSMQY